jgi:arylsulfatase A-like enzyme
VLFRSWHLGGAGFGPADQGWQTALECNGNTQPPKVTGSAEVRRTTDFLAQKAEEFIAANKDRPFLLQVSHGAVHIPLSTTPELKAKYEKKAPMPGYPSHPEYAGLTEELDQSVGRVVAAVERAGIAENTLILFLSDNGASAEIMIRGKGHDPALPPGSAGTYLCLGPGFSSLANTPFRRHKTWVHEGGIATPWIVHWPKGVASPGSLRRQPVHAIDVVPTVLELAAVAPPVEHDGRPVPPLRQRQ